MGNGHITERTLQAQKLEALGLFAGGIAHDFNNILSIIEGYTHIAVKQLQEGTLTQEQLKKIILSTQRGAGLTRQLLAFGRQKIELEEAVDIADVLRQQSILLKPLLGETIQVHMLVPNGALWVGASTDQIAQIVMNIAINARDAMPQGGDFSIFCGPCRKGAVPNDIKDKYPDGNFIKLSFVDSGMGIPSDTLARIFDPFFTTKSVTRGTGLGLSVVHGIINQVGGGVTVNSRLGVGTTFDFNIPQVAPPALSITPDLRQIDDILVGKTVLIAEDEPELRDVLVTMLNGMDMKVLAASNGNDALLVQDEYEGDIDFLLTDIVMPEMNGIKLGALFGSIRPQSNIVYMSGYPFIDGTNNQEIPAGSLFINKPLQEERIRKVLQRALERRDLREDGGYQ